MYLVDTNVLITAQKLYYNSDFCQGFWDFLVFHNKNKNIGIIQEIIDEIYKKQDDLSSWVKDNEKNLNIIDNRIEPIQRNYAKIIEKVSNGTVSKYFSDESKSKFLSNADPFLIASAQYYNSIVVTNEIKVESNSSKIKIPNICEYFDVRYESSPYNMMRALQARLVFDN